MFRRHRLLILPALTLLALVSCGAPDPSKLPTVTTPPHGKVDLSQISLAISDVVLERQGENQYSLSFDYTVTNHSGAHLAFTCLYSNTVDLIEVGLSDAEGQKLIPGRRPMEGLTLAEPKPLKLLSGPVTRNYTVPIMPEEREAGELINLRVRLHAPSRYDELRSTVEAPLVQVPWP
ncbi:hypothetical protein JIN77_13925 [Verrucomicrobiaceae bacterium R5-34]|nr:hypothetical protein [Verrucomicrobiaceae bacterium R5-34]